MPQDRSRPQQSRRTFLQFSASAAAAAGFGIMTEPLLAAQATENYPSNGVLINSNENPLGPSAQAREAAIAAVAQGGRYSPWLADELVSTFASLESLKTEYIVAFPGSSEPLHYSVLAYTSPARSYVTADPGYEAGMAAAKVTGARIVKTGLTKGYAHDVKAMLAAAPDAGLFYVCTPNNPTGTLTGHAEIEYLLENKPKGSIVLVDEAYIHFSDGTSVLDLVRADKELIVLRTFSKIYGMAGLRCGFAIGRPDLLARIEKYKPWSPMPITAVAAATASLKDARLVAERKRINAGIREETFAWLARGGYAYIASQSNCFLLDTKRPAKDVIAAMASENVIIGRVWPAMPTHVRISVGTAAEMEKFKAAFQRVMSTAAQGRLKAAPEMTARLSDLSGASRTTQ
jgi:histidinol-phosphate aminotransferase